MSNNRIEMAPPADPGLTNTVTAAWVGDGWYVNWTYLTTSQGRCVIGYTLAKGDAPATTPQHPTPQHPTPSKP